MSFLHLSSVAGASVVAATVLLAAPSTAEACSCELETLESAWFESTDTFTGRVLSATLAEFRTVYTIEVKHTFKGCTQPDDIVFVESPKDEAACGQRLTVGEKYLLTANEVAHTDRGHLYEISLCGYNRLTVDLTDEERDFLAGRWVFCPERDVAICADGTQPVECLVDPCSEVVCIDEPNECFSNYCGGCNAEFWDVTTGFPVCEL
jgi:hypothetical protein